MTESGEREVDLTDESVDSRRAATDDDGFEREADRRAEQFLELESQLTADTAGSLPEGKTTYGRVKAAEKAASDAVPETYPLDSDSEVLALEVEHSGTQTTRVYLEWPTADSDEETPLQRLLAAMGVPTDSLADLYGQELLLVVREGHYTVYIPEESPRGSETGRLGILGGLAGTAISLGAMAASVGPAAVWLLLFLFVTLFLLPLSTYRDAWHLRTHTDWEGGPLFWATLALLPGVNLVSSALYLASRRRASDIAR